MGRRLRQDKFSSPTTEHSGGGSIIRSSPEAIGVSDVQRETFDMSDPGTNTAAKDFIVVHRQALSQCSVSSSLRAAIGASDVKRRFFSTFLFRGTNIFAKAFIGVHRQR